MHRKAESSHGLIVHCCLLTCRCSGAVPACLLLDGVRRAGVSFALQLLLLWLLGVPPVCRAATADTAAVSVLTGTDAASTAAAIAAVQQQQQQFMSVELSNISPLVETRYNWKVNTTANVKAIQVPVDSQVGWPEVR